MWRQLNPGVDAQTVEVLTDASTSSATFTDLAGSAGPTATVYLEAGQKLPVIVEAELQVAWSGATRAVASFDIAGPSTSDLAAADGNGVESGVVSEWVPGTKHTVFTATASGNHVVTMRYRTIGGMVLFARVDRSCSPGVTAVQFR